jgi:hypothetical protein
MMQSLNAKLAAVAMLTTLLGACATTGTQRAEMMTAQLSKARVVDSFSALIPVALPMDQTTFAALGGDKPEISEQLALRTANGTTSFVKLYKLADWQAPYSINVASLMFGGADDPAIFYPRYMLLKRDFSQTRASVAKDFIYRTTAGSGMISSTVFINEENRDEAFLAIMAEPPGTASEELSHTQSASSVPLVVPFRGGSLTWLIPMGGNEAPKRMRAAVGGAVRLKTEMYQPKPVVSTPKRSTER